MVAKRRQPTKKMTEHERFVAMMESIPLSDEDPADFWGPDWREKLAEAEADIAAGRTRFFESTEAFVAHLISVDSDRADP